MRRALVGAVLAMTIGACARRPVAYSADVRRELAAADATTLNLLVLGRFELQSGATRAIVVRDRTPAIFVAVLDDTTMVLQVVGAGSDSDTLRLRFGLSHSAGGTYTLRRVNGAALGHTIRISGLAYQYVPCVQNAGARCLDPLPPNTTEDRNIRIGILR